MPLPSLAARGPRYAIAALSLAFAWTVAGAAAATQTAARGAAPREPASDSPQIASTMTLELADEAWRRRADNHRDDRAAAEPIGEAIAAYRAVLASDPGALEASWKLLRALYFQGEFATAEDDRAAVFEGGREVCETAVDRLSEGESAFSGVGGSAATELRRLFSAEPGVARLFFWCAVHWGLWGEAHGKLQAARQGVASEIRDYASAAVALDPAAESSGGHRVLGRLHAEAPRIPFFTGWISRETAIAELRRAAETAPREPLNRLYLAEALLDHGAAADRPEALELLAAVTALTPRESHRVEDLRAAELARRRLAAAR